MESSLQKIERQLTGMVLDGESPPPPPKKHWQPHSEVGTATIKKNEAGSRTRQDDRRSMRSRVQSVARCVTAGIGTLEATREPRWNASGTWARGLGRTPGLDWTVTGDSVVKPGRPQCCLLRDSRWQPKSVVAGVQLADSVPDGSKTGGNHTAWHACSGSVSLLASVCRCQSFGRWRTAALQAGRSAVQGPSLRTWCDWTARWCAHAQRREHSA